MNIASQLSSIAIDILFKLLSPLLRVLQWFYSKLPFKIVPRKQYKLGIIENSWREHQWEKSLKNDTEIIVIHTYWQITNTLPYNLTALNVFLTRPERVKGSVMIRNYKAEIWGHYPLPSGYTTDLQASFVIESKYIKHPEDILKVNIELQDPTGRTHKITNVIVKPFKINQTMKEKLVDEDPSKLSSEIEKQVVSVLKNELEQYKVRGRREGRLGTVDWPKGAIEWRDSDAAIKFLFESSNKSNVNSEHLDALLNLYKKSSQNEKDEIITALLKRLDKKMVYRDVGYLIIFFLFEVGMLNKGLGVALKKLQGDKANAFGDVLRILDFLLAFRYEEFDEAELNDIEKFVYSTKEHPFQIKERINAIRVKKM